jgi:hypothetical protein
MAQKVRCVSAQGRCWLAECDRCRRCLSCSHRALCFLHTGHHRLAPSAPLPHRLVTVLQLVSFVLYNLFWPAVFDCCASLFDCDWPDLRSGIPLLRTPIIGASWRQHHAAAMMLWVPCA